MHKLKTWISVFFYQSPITSQFLNFIHWVVFKLLFYCVTVQGGIDQFQYIKIQPKTIHLSTKLWEITAEFVGFISQSLIKDLLC